MTYTALKLSSSSNDYDPTKSGFETEELAYEYIKSHRCELCESEEGKEDAIFACDAEWMTLTDEEMFEDDTDFDS